MIITIEQALNKAFWKIQVPSMLVIMIPLLSYILLSKYGFLPSRGYAGLKWFGPVFIFGFIGGWLVWSIQVPRWRLWAYQRVSNIKELKRAAIDSQIIWPEGHFLQKTEIASNQVWQQIKKIEASKSVNT